MTNDSMITDVRSWRREAPIVRSVANSRVRCATVIESVLKMTNAPTKSAMPANESRKYRMNLVNSTDSRSSSVCSAAERTVTWSAGSVSLSSATSASGVVPSAAATEISSNWPSRSSRRCASGIVKTANVAEPSDSTSPYCARPVILNSSVGWIVAMSTVSPIL